MTTSGRRVADGNVVELPYQAFPSTSVLVPEGEIEAARAIFGNYLTLGRFDFVRRPDEPDLRTILDLGAGAGVFAAWAMYRWPYAWIDCVELDEDLRRLCIINAPPGARVHATDITKEIPASAPVANVELLMLVDAVHCTPAFELCDLPLEFSELKAAVIETETTAAFMRAATFLHGLGLELVSADVNAQTWIRPRRSAITEQPPATEPAPALAEETWRGDPTP